MKRRREERKRREKAAAEKERQEQEDARQKEFEQQQARETEEMKEDNEGIKEGNERVLHETVTHNTAHRAHIPTPGGSSTHNSNAISAIHSELPRYSVIQ